MIRDIPVAKARSLAQKPMFFLASISPDFVALAGTFPGDRDRTGMDRPHHVRRRSANRSGCSYAAPAGGCEWFIHVSDGRDW
jgi:hypothetical protein